MSVNASVRAVITRHNKKQGAGTVVIGSDIIGAEHPTITSGSLSIDVALGGGWAVNHFIEVIGHKSAGKTAIILKTIAANQKRDPNWTVVWLASEDFVETYALMLGVDMARVIIVNDCIMESVFETAIEFAETNEIDCIVIDSLPALVPEKEFEDMMGDFQVGLAPRLTNKWLRKMNPFVKRSLIEQGRPLTVFMLNQWRNKIGGYGDPRTAPGGMGKDFYAFQQVEVINDEDIKNTKNMPIGQVLRIRNIKNKFAPRGRTGYVDYYFDRGNGFSPGSYDLVKDMISAALAYDVIAREGQRNYVFGDYNWSGRPAVEKAIRGDRDVRARLRKAILAVASKPATEQPKSRVRGRTAASVEETGDASQ